MSEFLVLAHWSADSPFGFMSAPLFEGDKPRLFSTIERANLDAGHMNATRGTSRVFYAAAPRQMFEERIGPIPEAHKPTSIPFDRSNRPVTPDDYETRALLLGWRPSDIAGLWTRTPAEEGKLAPLRAPDEIWSEVEAASVESLNEMVASLAEQTTYMAASRDLKVGDVVCSTGTLESYPHYSIEPGARFVVTLNELNESHPILSLRLVPEDSDNLKAGNLREWGNCVEIYGPEWEGVEHDPGVGAEDTEQFGHAWNKSGIPIRKDNSALDFADRLAGVYTYRLAKAIGSTLMEIIVALNAKAPVTEPCASGKFADTTALIESIYLEIREDEPIKASADLVEEVRSRARFKYFPIYAATPDDDEAEETGSRSEEPLPLVAPNPLAEPLLELLQYVGGWDLTDPEHPIVKARKAYEAAIGEKF